LIIPINYGTHNPKVASSNLAPATNKKSIRPIT
jgi:hypothetical protein